MYFTSLPNHDTPGFDEQLHFSRFGSENIIFNATSHAAHCDNHVGCLSIKTVLSGEEWYGINGRQVAVRPGNFLILNDGQEYSCRIENGSVRTVSVFFKREFSSQILHDEMNSEEHLLDNPFRTDEGSPEFIQTLHDTDQQLRSRLSLLIQTLETEGYEKSRVDENLISLLGHLVRTHQQDVRASKKIRGLKTSTKKEVYKRVCVARDVLNSRYGDKMSLEQVGKASSLSIPQLVRQFKSVFGVTPHRYLTNIRLQRAVEFLQQTNTPINEIAWNCGFENASAFSRAFRAAYGHKATALRMKR
jgi:AraC family transcriptional regulator